MKQSYRERAIRRRFPARAQLSKDDLWRQYFSNLQRESVLNCLSAFELEFRLDPGFLRPDDSLTALFAPVHTWNPFRWMFYRGIENEGASELAHEVTKRLDAVNASRGVKLSTFGDLVRAWCGVSPVRTSETHDRAV
jgi:hypothetical protein